MSELTFISLFAGIGGLDLGLERAGLRCVAQVEIDDYACKVLARHWPDVVRFGDIRTVGAHNLPAADCLVGGFPCQDISNAGKQAGIGGERSGLWTEYYRLICELRPHYIVVENVAALLHRGMETVLSDLAAGGYDAEWQVLPAAAFGAPHKRERLFILAHTNQSNGQTRVGYQLYRTPPLFRNTYPQRNELWLQAPRRSSRVDDGVSSRLYESRVGALGNAVVPQVAEYIGACIVAHATEAEGAA